MNYGEVRDAALKLINQYSLAGTEIESTYNNQADYLRRIPELVDDAVWKIATGPRRILERKELRVEPTRDSMGLPVYTLPEDFMDITPDGLLVVESKYETPSWDSGYVRVDEHHIVFPKRGRHFHGHVFLLYYRKPRSIKDCKSGAECPLTGGTCNCTDGEYGQPPDCAVIDNESETHRPIPYFVAASLVKDEDAYVHDTLLAQWADLYNNLYQQPMPHRGVVEDVYSGTLDYWAW